MDQALHSEILDLLSQHRIMTVATNRPDGWPQATTVAYVNIGLTLYFWTHPQSQKAANILRDKRISLTIAADPSKPIAIKGLSMAADAELERSPSAATKAAVLLDKRYPELGAYRAIEMHMLSVYRVTPRIISVIDYSKGFGHTEQVAV